MTAAVLRADARCLPLPDASVDLLLCSPPYYGLRSYTDNGEHYDGQIGSEATPREWLAAMLECTAEWMRVLKPSGSIFVNLGDKYSTGASGENGTGTSSLNGHGGDGTQRDRAVKRSSPAVRGVPPKSLLGLPWRYALACMDDLGLILRRDIIWAKPNSLPESVQDRCRSSHEYLFHLVKQPRYYAAVDEIREAHAPRSWEPTKHGHNAMAGRNASLPRTATGDYTGPNPLGKLPGSVWEIPSQPLTVPAHLGVDHFAAFPMELPRRIILGWSPPGICVACGEGRRPVTDKGGPDPALLERRGLTAGRWHEDDGPRGRMARYNISGTEAQRTNIPATITGYACACPDATAPTRPAIVADPFGGTGTTALVADMLGRTGVSFDLSADYCRLARWRTRDPAERARALGVPKPPPVPDGQGDLFAEVAP